MTLLSTGELAHKAGVSLRTVRWYTEAGLLFSVNGSTENSRRKYAVSAVEQVKKIRLLAETGMKLSQIHELLQSIQSLSTEKKARTHFLRKRIEQQVQAINEKVQHLQQARRRLDKVLEQTQRCQVCPSRGEKQDCSPCRNLAVLQDAVIGCSE